MHDNLIHDFSALLKLQRNPGHFNKTDIFIQRNGGFIFRERPQLNKFQIGFEFFFCQFYDFLRHMAPQTVAAEIFGKRDAEFANVVLLAWHQINARRARDFIAALSNQQNRLRFFFFISCASHFASSPTVIFLKTDK
jgi:hypothetical protein